MSPPDQHTPFRASILLQGTRHVVGMSLNKLYVLLALVSLQAVLPSAAHAQQTISTYTVGPIYGNDSSITVTTSGTIDGTVSGTGVISTGTNTTTTLINVGAILGSSYGILNEPTGSFGTITNSGTISGDNGVYTTGTIGTVTNTSTGLITGGILGFLQRGGSVDQFSNAGVITSDGYAVGFDTGATLGSLTNSGTMIGATQGLILAVTGTVTNLAGAVISGTASDGLDTFGNVGLIDNAGSIYGLYRGVFIAAGSVTDLTNTGSINSGDAGLVMDTSTTLGTLTNSGTISGGGSGAVLSTTGTVTNNAGGSIRGDDVDGLGLGTIGNIGLIDNAGSIYGGDSGLYIAAGSVGVINNSGTIDGGTAGLQIVGGTTLGVLTNSGTIGVVLNEGTIGAGAGPAISSTGTAASIGSIIHTGTINQGFQIENQNVSVGAGVGVGVFNGGTLDVVDGDLTFTDGTIALNADVLVNGGSGTFINQAILALSGSQSVTGNFQQTSGGTALIDLLGVTGGTYGHLFVSGAADFAGGLELDDTSLSGGLSGGQNFELFSFSSYVGGFDWLAVDGTNLTSLGSGQWAYDSLTLTEVWTSTTMSLTVTGATAVPEIDPNSLGSVLALVLGSLGLLERRRLKAA